jgi:oxygen-independent coproporphyrinogen-3 oxidase
MSTFFSLPPLTLYIHIPWCLKKCPYCDFNSHAIKNMDSMPVESYLNALLRDIDAYKERLNTRSIEHIYIGGGTPSLFPVAKLHILLAHIYKQFSVNPQAEVTMEVNPGSKEYVNFDYYLQAGINRLSFGVQSFQPSKLQKLGRIHTADQAIKAIKNAHDSGFDNINIDLMYGLPEQTLSEALIDLQTAFDLLPSHLSWYQLSIEPNTAFYFKPPALPNENMLNQIEKQCTDYLANNGWHAYEVAAYAQSKNNYCQHNLNYWHFGDYIGIGAGAHSKLTYHDNDDNLIIKRSSKIYAPQSYIKAQGSCFSNSC